MCGIYLGSDERTQSVSLVIGEGAAPDNRFEDTELCFNISVGEDMIKEGIETFALSLESMDDCVSLGRDRAVVSVEENGGRFQP